MTTPADKHISDEGLGLIELIVAIVVTGIIMSAIVTIFVNSWKTQEQVLSQSAATNRGQVVGSMIERAVRNASVIDLSGTRLRVHTTLGGGLTCQGFAVSGGDVVLSTSTTALPGTWPVWDPAISPSNAAPYFVRQAGSQVVTYVFDLQTDSAPVRITGQVTPRVVPVWSTTDPGGCW